MVDVFGDSYNNIVKSRKNAEQSYGAIRVQSQNGSSNSLIYPVIFEQFSSRNNENTQVLNGFDEVIHSYAYGKAAGQVTLAGKVLADCNENRKLQKTNDLLIKKYQENLRAFSVAKKGDLVKISGPGGIVLSGYADALVVNASSEHNNFIDFTMAFTIVSSSSGVSSGASNSAGVSGGSTSSGQASPATTINTGG